MIMAGKRPRSALDEGDSGDDDRDIDVSRWNSGREGCARTNRSSSSSLGDGTQARADRGFAPVRFVRKYTIPEDKLAALFGKSARSLPENNQPDQPRSVAFRIPKDAWQLALEFVDTMSLRAFALCCSRFAVMARVS